MYEVYINYLGESHKVTEHPVFMDVAYNVIEEDHSGTTQDLNFILNRPSLKGLHDAVRERMNEGDDYDIVSALTGEVIRKIHCAF